MSNIGIALNCYRLSAVYRTLLSKCSRFISKGLRRYVITVKK